MVAGSPVSGDDWTSDRVTMAVIYDPKKGEETLAAFAVQKTVHEEYPRIRLLDRKSLDEIVREFELSRSDLVRPENRLTPDLWTVRLFLVLEAVNSDVVMRLDETRTGKILDFFHARLESGRSPFDQREKLTESLLRILRERHPLRGRISQVTKQEIILDIGEDVGVRIGQRFQALGTDLVLKVVSLRSDGTSTAQVERGDDMPEKGGKVAFFPSGGQQIRSAEDERSGLSHLHLPNCEFGTPDNKSGVRKMSICQTASLALQTTNPECGR